MKEQNINLTIKPFGPRNGEYYNYVCIDGGDGNLTSYDGNSPLLDEPAASSTPQFVVIKRDITVNEIYTFASGSKILVLPGKNLQIYNDLQHLQLFIFFNAHLPNF